MQRHVDVCERERENDCDEFVIVWLSLLLIVMLVVVVLFTVH